MRSRPSLLHRLVVVGAIACGAATGLPVRAGPAGGGEPSQDASVRIESQGWTIHGTVDLPSGPGPFPLLISIAGSGPTDRDGNQALLHNDCLKLLGRALSDRGVAVLRYDKRGVGASRRAQQKEQDLRFEMFVDDAAACVAFARRDARFSRVGILGHSEGALVGTLAARRAKADAFVALAGCGTPAATGLRRQLAANLPPSLRDRSFEVIDEIAAGRRVDDVPPELLPLFRPSVQPYLISYFRYDPARELALLDMPVLVVQGTTDLQCTPDDARLLPAAREGAELRLVEGMNHVLKRAGDYPQQLATYRIPWFPVVPEAVDAVAEFVHRTSEAGPPRP